MSLLQSALDFLAGPGSLGGAAGRDQTDFVGQTVELGELRLRVRRVLAEGEARAGCRGSARGGRARGEPGRAREGHGQARGVRRGRGSHSRCGADLRLVGRLWQWKEMLGRRRPRARDPEGWSRGKSSATWPFPWRRGLPRAVGQPGLLAPPCRRWLQSCPSWVVGHRLRVL